MNTEPIETQPVESKNIARLGYDWPGATLAVVFKKHLVIYHYHPVPKPMFEQLRKAPSLGGYFARFIRNSPSIRGILWCDCGVFAKKGEHLEECVSHRFDNQEAEESDNG